MGPNVSVPRQDNSGVETAVTGDLCATARIAPGNRKTLSEIELT